MNRGNGLFFSLVVISVVLGLLVATYPIDKQYASLRPELICLLVIYWVLTAPQQFGVLFAWSIGLLQGIVEGVTWGGHGLALGIVAYICIVAHQRIKNYSVWHQSMWVFILVGFHQVIVNWVQGLSGYSATPGALLLSTIVSALLWPLVFVTLHKIRHAYRYY